MTEMGLSKKGQSALFEIEKADDWDLAAPAGALPPTAEAQAAAEIKLDLRFLNMRVLPAAEGSIRPS